MYLNTKEGELISHDFTINLSHSVNKQMFQLVGTLLNSFRGSVIIKHFLLPDFHGFTKLTFIDFQTDFLIDFLNKQEAVTQIVAWICGHLKP